jgi:oligopeptide/dipeptide ABC transporter ATP-binding protein
VRAVDSVSFRVRQGEVYGLVGETGSGKSTIARTLVGIYAPTSGSVRLMGEEVDYRRSEDLAKLRASVGIVFQDPVGSLNPRLKVREIVAEAVVASRKFDSSKRPAMIESAVQMVGLRKSALESYPKELSGGEKQRVSLARALVIPKKLLVLDEPTSSLDVSVQAQVLNLLRKLREELKLSIIFITHDINVIRYMSDHLGILFYGKLIEHGPTRDVVSSPKHPYSQKLMANVLGLKRVSVSENEADKGPSPVGCVYSKVCPSVFERCSEVPPMYHVGPDASAACFLYDEKKASLTTRTCP